MRLPTHFQHPARAHTVRGGGVPRVAHDPRELRARLITGVDQRRQLGTGHTRGDRPGQLVRRVGDVDQRHPSRLHRPAQLAGETPRPQPQRHRPPQPALDLTPGQHHPTQPPLDRGSLLGGRQLGDTDAGHAQRVAPQRLHGLRRRPRQHLPEHPTRPEPLHAEDVGLLDQQPEALELGQPAGDLARGGAVVQATGGHLPDQPSCPARAVDGLPVRQPLLEARDLGHQLSSRQSTRMVPAQARAGPAIAPPQ
jgi:hypothetical protein